MANQPVIVGAKRTPIGRFFGGLSKVPSPQLGAYAIQALLEEVPAMREHVDECVMGCVLQAGLGQNPARQAGLKAGLPSTLSAKTIKAGDTDCVIAGGMENMTAAPHYVFARDGIKFGQAGLQDHMQHDGLYCAFEEWGMTNAADYIAKKHGISREEQDRFSARSHLRAAEATQEGHFKGEIVALTGEQVGNRKKPGPEGGVSADEGIRPESTQEVLSGLRTVPGHEFITAGNASQISDGAAAIGVMSSTKAEELGVTPMARIVSYHTHGVDPKDIFEAPIEAINGVLRRAEVNRDDVDLFEINEAFAAQVLCNIKELGIPEEKVNICGGGVALGHPIGASGARVLTTLLHQLKRTGGKTGVAALCLGGGNAVAMVVEAV